QRSSSCASLTVDDAAEPEVADAGLRWEVRARRRPELTGWEVPGAAPDDATRTLGRSWRVDGRGIGGVVGRAAGPHPLPHGAGHVVEAVRADACRVATHRSDVSEAGRSVGPPGLPLVSPGVAPPVVAAGGPLPLGFGREPTLPPPAIRLGLEPA